MNRALISVALIVVVAGFSSGQTPFEPIAAKVRSQALNLPATVSLVSLSPADRDHPRQTYTIQRTFAPDGSFTTAWKSAILESTQRYRADGTILSSQQTDIVKGLSLEVTSDTKRTGVHTVISAEGKVKSDKKADLKPGIVLRDELQHLILQGWEAGIRDGLKFQSLSPDGGMVGDFQILYKVVSDPLSVSDLYTFPAEFKAFFDRSTLGGQKSYVVADMSLQGIGAVFYPHHFYLVYVPMGNGLEFRGYFGEDPKKPLFQYVLKSTPTP